MADVQIAVRLGGKTGDHSSAVLAGLQIGCDDLADEVPRLGIIRHWPCPSLRPCLGSLAGKYFYHKIVLFARPA